MNTPLRNFYIFPMLGLILACLQPACLSTSKIRADAQVVRVDIDKAKELGAYRCAPKELALAETNHVFCMDELKQGNWHQAGQHIDKALLAVRQALDKSKDCKIVELPKTSSDSDGDGILDTLDKCPNDPEDIDQFQDEDGCPDPDNDGDGLLDMEDACPIDPGPPDSPQGKGCPRKFSLVKIDRDKQRIEIKQTVYFASGKWRILRRSFRLLNQVAQALADYPKMRVSIEGHTDSMGSDRLNQRLSENRAIAVRTYLTKRGIEADRLETIGYGEAMPIASNRTGRGRSTNRRVEFRIISEK